MVPRTMETRVVRRKFRSVLASLAIAVVLTAAPRGAWAHAIVTGSEPAAGSTVAGPAVAVRIKFNSRIDVARSRLTLNAPGGKTRVLALKPESGPDNLLADATELGAGAYTLHWQVLSVDGHISRGDVPFKVTAPPAQ